MNRKELRQIIRAEVKKALYEEFPGMIVEVLTEVLADVAPPTPAPQPRRNPKPLTEESKKSFAELMGYGEYSGGTTKSQGFNINGVQMDGGLAAHEARSGVSSHMATNPELLREQGGEASILDAGAAMPDFLQKAIGNAKKVVDEVDRKQNYRPGRR